MEAPEVPLEAAQEHIHEHAHGHHGGEKAWWILGVALSSALVAALAAVASLKAGHHANEALLGQIEANNLILKASDKWSYYQAKGVKLAVLVGKIDTVKALRPAAAETTATAPSAEPAATPGSESKTAAATEPPATNSEHKAATDSEHKSSNDSEHKPTSPDKAAKKKETDEEKVKRYEKEQEQISEEAHELEEEAKKVSAEGKEHLEVHLGLAKSVTMFQICIAIAAISVLTNRQLFWYVSLAFAAYGVYTMVLNLLH